MNTTNLGIFSLPPRTAKSPTATNDGQEKLLISDANARELLGMVVTELRITNHYLSFITKEEFTEDDLE